MPSKLGMVFIKMKQEKPQQRGRLGEKEQEMNHKTDSSSQGIGIGESPFEKPDFP
jgi:hypothetical protein